MPDQRQQPDFKPIRNCDYGRRALRPDDELPDWFGSRRPSSWPTAGFRESLRPAFPVGSLGQPEDIAGIVSWIVSKDCAWLTGQVINAEGGFRS